MLIQNMKIEDNNKFTVVLTAENHCFQYTIPFDNKHLEMLIGNQTGISQSLIYQGFRDNNIPIEDSEIFASVCYGVICSTLNSIEKMEN